MGLVHQVFELAFPLFLIMDPLANSATAIVILKGRSIAEQQRILVRELLFALVLMIVFQFLGQGLLDLLDIKQSTLRIAGGIILFIISLKLVFPEEQGSLEEAIEDPFLVPIATPFIAGPSLLAAIMVYAHQEKSSLVVFLSILLAWSLALVVMVLATRLQRFLGERGSRAVERLMGLILILMAVQMLEQGVQMFLKFQ